MYAHGAFSHIVSALLHGFIIVAGLPSVQYMMCR